MLSGEVDLALGDDLEYAGRDAIDRGAPVRLDVSRVSFIDSVGLGFLARMASAEREQGRLLPLAGARRNIQESVNLVGSGGPGRVRRAGRRTDRAAAQSQNGTTGSEG